MFFVSKHILEWFLFQNKIKKAGSENIEVFDSGMKLNKEVRIVGEKIYLGWEFV